uniref:Uncharacterized protein n=1 Tax=Dictyoglomus turgidum TaxID=513050 RepID=A0A7C3WVS0_9BACT
MKQDEKLFNLLNNLKPADKKEVLFLLKNPQFERKPCDSFYEFVDNPYYLGVGKDVWRRVKEEGDKIWKGILEGRYQEGICLWGIGSGKSFLAEIISCLYVHYLLCLENPHKYFNMTDDKPIVVVNMGTNASQAKNVIFAGIRRLIENSPFFQEYQPEILQTEIRFPKKNIALYCGNSQETMPIGLNVICGVLDEAAWYLDNEEKSIAENIYSTMKNRIVSRFGDKGFIFVISAPRYADDFITRLYEKSKGKDYVYASSFKTWEVKDREMMKQEEFEFNAGNEIWKVPMDFKNIAEANPEKFMRDFGAKPSMVLEAFDRDADIVERNYNPKRESPVDELGRFKEWFKATDSEPRYIHIDLGYKKDACGLAMGRFDGYDEVDGEKRPKVYIDLMLQIKPSETSKGEVVFEDVRRIVYSLKERGFNIALVTFDGFQSVDSIQILKAHSINAEVLSVDRDTKPYETLKELLHTNRIDFYRYEPFIKEYKRLELVKGKKVDHPLGGSKDVADAVAAVCYNICQRKVSGFFEYIKTTKPQEQASELQKWYELYRNQGF